MDSTSDSELARATAKAAELKQEIEVRKRELETMQASFTEVSMEIVKMLETLEIDSIKQHGFTFFIEEKESVKTPKTLEDKKEFFQYLRELGLFEEMVTVNSMTLNSFYKSMSQEAAEKGVLDFRMPGIEEPTAYKTLKLRRA